jgi:glutathione S-transferase
MASARNPELKLWFSPRACSFVPHVALCEAGLKAELILAEVGAEEFKSLNPKGRVPVLAIGDEIITEMSAVLTGISSLAPEAHLFGQSSLETIRVYEWLNYLSTTGHAQSFASVWRSERFTNDPDLYPSIQSRGVENIRDVYALIEGKLAESDSNYAVGGSFTVVDPFLVLLYLWAGRLNIETENTYPKYILYVNSLLRRESVIEACKVHANMGA